MRAIILAAGMGTRLRPLTDDKPKSLVEVAGEAMTERQVRFLKEKGIDDIVIVVGYKKEAFEYLVDKYGVKLVFNEKFNTYNNIYSMYKVRDLLAGSYVLEGDIYMNRNIIDTGVSRSTYFSCHKEGFVNEWKLVVDSNDKVTGIDICDGDGYIMCGVSYWDQTDGQYIKEKLDRIEDIDDYQNKYWDDVVRDNMKDLDVTIKKLEKNDLMEIDNVEDLKRVEDYLRTQVD
nr:sugar phosphate nucleotidyltransferase [uncultured Peptostreptococcus sp.]